MTSSEKVDREQRYRGFNVSSLPYPGCEFFRRYRDNDHEAVHLVFQWDDAVHDAKLNLHALPHRDRDRGGDGDGHIDGDHEDTVSNGHHGVQDVSMCSLGIDWSEYQQWDIVTLTQNYFALFTKHITASLQGGDFGVLIHCISGWDRTPLFVSLLRLSLWADGVVHVGLSAAEVLYLTLAYDWLLFTHQFGNRLLKGEDIMHFTFYALRRLVDAQYAVQYTHPTPSGPPTGDMETVTNTVMETVVGTEKRGNIQSLCESPDCGTTLLLCRCRVSLFIVLLYGVSIHCKSSTRYNRLNRTHRDRVRERERLSDY